MSVVVLLEVEWGESGREERRVSVVMLLDVEWGESGREERGGTASACFSRMSQTFPPPAKDSLFDGWI